MRSVTKIEPARYQTFDQQFWPIVVALTVLCGIGIGAIVALLKGPWLWGSLLLLPTLVAFALVFLYRLDDSKLRRSLQLSIIVSMALHLLLIVFASLTNIFHSRPRTTPQNVAQVVPRTIEISDRRASFVWEEPNHQKIPEPEVEQVRRQPPQTDVKPQPVLVDELTPSKIPEIVRRETPAESIPRLDKDLSELKSQLTQSEPRPRRNRLLDAPTIETSTPSPSQPTKKTETAKTQPTPETSKSSESESVSENLAAAVAVKRSNSREPSIEKTKPVPTETKPNVELADSAPPPSPVREREQPSPPKSSASAALRTAKAPNLAQSKSTRENTQREQKRVESETKPEPAPAATELTRRPTLTERLSPTTIKTEIAEQRSTNELAQSAQRRTTELALPTISNESSTRVEPRRSAVDAEVALSTAPVERPALPTESETSEAVPNPSAQSISRSTTGTAGVGRSRNLESATGGAPSPALRPSDSAARVEAQSQRSEVRQLVAAQSPAIRRSTHLAPNPTSALKAEVSTPTNVAGGPTAAERTLESAAAKVESSRADNRSQVSLEKGSASVDLGPTKVLPDQSESSRRSGGGQTEIAQLNPEPALRSRTTGNQQPSLSANSAQVTLAPSTQASAPTSSELSPNADSTSISKSGGDSPSTLERDSAVIAGEHSDAGRSELAAEIAAGQPRASSRQSDAGDIGEIDNQTVSNAGNQRTAISAAPNIKGEIGLGNSDRPTGSSLADSDEANNSPGEAAMEVSRTVETIAQGSGIGKTSTSEATNSISRESVDRSVAPRRNTMAGYSDLGSVAQDNPRPTENRRRRDSKLAGSQPMANLSDADSKATLGPKPDSPFDADLDADANSEGESLDPSDVEITRDDVPSSEQGLEMQIVAIEGTPGLTKIPSDSLGTMARPSDKESLQIQPNPDSRFRKRNFGGQLAINPDAVLAQEAYRNRTSSALVSASEPSTEAAIHLGLQFLIRAQNPDGSWSLGNFDPDHPQRAAQLNSDAAATGLALLVFQGAGYNHREYKHALVMRRAVYWLIENQQENGCLYVEADKKSNEACRMYSHGIAALALTEAYGMTLDPRLKEPAQKAIDYIINSQDPRKGGWRYFDEPKSRSTDTSVSGWMMMALHSGRLVGLQADEKGFQGVNKWLDVAVDPDDPSKFRYNPFAVDADGVSRIQGKRPTATMTSVGLLMRIYGGLEPDDPTLVNGATWLVRNHLPSDETPEQRDTYYWYYATQVLKYIDGPLWEEWDSRLRPMLIQSQIKTGDMAGSWHPYNPIPDRWGAFGGRLYVTTMNLLSLEVRHRMLPLYKKTNQPDEN